MKAYILSILGASFASALVGILAPNGSAKHMKLISSLFLICVLVAPLPKAVGSIRTLVSDFTEENQPQSPDSDYSQQMQEAINSASRTYFAQTLTQMLERQFSIPSGEIRCAVQWSEDSDHLQPRKVTLILSGSAIWKNPAELEQFVTNLLGCECVSAIE